MKNIYTYLLGFIIVFSSCRSASKAFEKGNYEDAISLAIKAINKDPNDETATSVLRDAYSQAVKEHEATIATLNKSSSNARFERIYNEYRDLQKLYEKVNDAPAALKIISPVNYSEYVQTYKEKTGDVYYEKGLALMERGDKLSYRAAYREFKTASRFKNTTALENAMQEAFDGAVVRVLIVANDQYGNYNNNYGGYNNYNTSYQFRNLQEEIIRNIRYQNNDEFVQFLTEFDTRIKDVVPDEIVEMHLGNIDFGRYHDSRSSREVSKQVVIKETVYRPDSIVTQYGTVTARITTTKRTYTSLADMSITSRDSQGRYLWNDIVRSEYRSQVEFATYTGDQRALSSSDLTLLNQNPDRFNQPREDDIMNELIRQLQEETTRKFRNYFSRYGY